MKNYLYLFVDIDGTCADGSQRFITNPLPVDVKEDRSNVVYVDWLSKIQKPAELLNDKPIGPVRSLLQSLTSSLVPPKVIYLTSRDILYKEATVEWLRDNGFPYAPLMMRLPEDKGPYQDFKEKAIKHVVGDDLVSWVQVVLIDDDPRGGLEEVCKRNKWVLLKAFTGSVCH